MVAEVGHFHPCGARRRRGAGPPAPPGPARPGGAAERGGGGGGAPRGAGGGRRGKREAIPVVELWLQANDVRRRAGEAPAGDCEEASLLVDLGERVPAAGLGLDGFEE